MSRCQAAILTGQTSAGIATIQLRGEESHSVLQKIFRPQSQTKNDLHYGDIYDDDEMIDQVVVTMEPMEIHCHGGPRVVQRLLLLLEKKGVAITTWQKLSPPTTIAAEIQATLPQAKTRRAVLTLSAQNPGGLSKWVQNTMKSPNSLAELRQRIQKLLPTYALAQKLLNGLSIALTGPANVGKSTLANRLSGQQQSIVADMAGTTRDWTAQWMDIDGIPVELIDTPGRRRSKDTLEQTAIAQANQKLTQADLIILIVQADGHEQEQIQQQLALLPPKTNPLIVINKMDLIPENQQLSDALYLSATTGKNLDKLRQTIGQRCGFNNLNPQAPLIFTQRQHNHLRKALEATAIEKAHENLKKLLDNPC